MNDSAWVAGIILQINGLGTAKKPPATCAKRGAKFRHGCWGYFQFSGRKGWNMLLVFGVEVDWFVGVGGMTRVLRG